ncbi:hypothetical protein ABTL18_20010, partial [Acinetobacter baumannii]
IVLKTMPTIAVDAMRQALRRKRLKIIRNSVVFEDGQQARKQAAAGLPVPRALRSDRCKQEACCRSSGQLREARHRILGGQAWVSSP